jgi:hypothetical protein
MEDWGGAKNEHGHTRVIGLDIPASISDGAFDDFDESDDYGEESYEEAKPYTGVHPSEQKSASSGSSGGYELEDFGSSGSGDAGDFGGAKNEHGHTRVLNLDIPASISEGAFDDYGDDEMYGELSYEEAKPYTGVHPSEQKKASSGSSGGYELEDFGSSGSGDAGDFGGAKNEHGHTRVLNLDIPATISEGPATGL